MNKIFKIIISFSILFSIIFGILYFNNNLSFIGFCKPGYKANFFYGRGDCIKVSGKEGDRCTSYSDCNGAFCVLDDASASKPGICKDFVRGCVTLLDDNYDPNDEILSVICID